MPLSLPTCASAIGGKQGARLQVAWRFVGERPHGDKQSTSIIWCSSGRAVGSKNSILVQTCVPDMPDCFTSAGLLCLCSSHTLHTPNTHFEAHPDANSSMRQRTLHPFSSHTLHTSHLSTSTPTLKRVAALTGSMQRRAPLTLASPTLFTHSRPPHSSTFTLMPAAARRGSTRQRTHFTLATHTFFTLPHTLASTPTLRPAAALKGSMRWRTPRSRGL